MMLLPLWAIFGSILVSYYNGVRWSPVVGGGGVWEEEEEVWWLRIYIIIVIPIPTHYYLFRIMLKLGLV